MDCACGKPVMGKQDVCRRCFFRRLNQSPAHIAKRDAGIAARWAKPGEREKQALVCKRSVQKRDATPGMRERYVEMGKKHYQTLNLPEVRAKTHSPETNALRTAAMLETRLGWCPPEYREEYRALRNSHGITAAEARRMILAMIEAKRVKAEREMSPFERQERALQRGAALVRNIQKPSLSNPGVYSFGGRAA
jgi:hypothetical protein